MNAYPYLGAAIVDPTVHDAMRAQILRAFGVTEADLAALDPDGSYAAGVLVAVREERYVREVLIPRIQANVQAEIDRVVREEFVQTGELL